MKDLQATAEMLIRASRREAFRAFTSAEQLCKFWLERASADLSAGATVEWHFKVPGARDQIRVLALQPDERIKLEWSGGSSVVEMLFADHASGATHIAITVTGFSGDDAAAKAIGTTEGFAIVLCDLKSLLETGRSGEMVRDKALLIASRRS